MRFRDYLKESAEDYRPQLFQFLRDQPDNTLVHFTRADKIGINTRPPHQDPIGVYAFPKNYVLNNIDKNHHFFGMKNAFVIRLKGNAKTLNLSELSMEDVDKLLDRMGISEFKEKIDRRDRDGKPGHVLWDTMEKSMGDMPGRGKKNMQWVRLFKKAGDFDALIDTGDAIIHHNEPNQVVILNPAAYVVIGKISTNLKNTYKALAERIVRMLADKLLGSYRIYTKSESYNRKVISARSTKDGKLMSLSFHYENDSTDRNQSDLRGTVYISSPLSSEYKKADIRVPLSNGSAEEAVASALEQLIPYTQANFQEKDNIVPDIIAAVTRNLGLGKPGKINDNFAVYKKLYPQGLLTINVGQFRNEVVFCNFVIEKKSGGFSSFGNYVLHGKAEMPVPQAKANINVAARKLIQDNLSVWKDAIETYYNPDYDKHKDYDKTHGYAFDKVNSGQHLTRFLNFMMSKLQRTQ